MPETVRYLPSSRKRFERRELVPENVVRQDFLADREFLTGDCSARSLVNPEKSVAYFLSGMEGRVLSGRQAFLYLEGSNG
jgi:hypothetical protein